MGTVFNGQAEDIQFKLSAGDGISITGDNSNVISALRTATSLEMTSPGMYFVPASTAAMPNGTQGCGMLLVMEGEVGGGSEGYIQYLVMYGSAFTRSYYQGWGDWTRIADSSVGTLSPLASGGKVSGKSLSSNDYTDEEKAAVATIANKLNLPLYDMGNIDADALTTPGIYATSYAGPQNFPFTDSAAMPLLIVAEAGRMPDISSGSPDFSNAKTLLQICIGKGGELYSRYKIAGSGDLSSWSWSPWSTKAVSVTNSLGSSSTTAALSAAQGKTLDEKKVDKETGKGLSTNDYTDAEKSKVASAISETDAKAAFAAKGKLTDCHGFDGAGIYSIPYNAANLPDGVSFPQSKNAMLVVTYSNNMSWTNYEYSMTLILPDGVVYTQQRMGEKDYSSFTAWTRAYSDKQDKAWQTLASLTVAEGEEASSIKIALPDAITTCNELMIEAEFYVGSEATSQWRPTFCFADVDKAKYNCWLGGGGTGSVTPGTKYYFELCGWVGDSRLLTFYGPANQHMHANSRATAYTGRTSLTYRNGHSSYTCYLHMEIGSNTFAAGTKIKLLGR